MTRCLPLTHDWMLDASRIVRQLWDGRVYGHQTEVIYRCNRCESVKVKTIKGAWVLEHGSMAKAPPLEESVR